MSGVRSRLGTSLLVAAAALLGSGVVPASADSAPGQGRVDGQIVFARFDPGLGDLVPITVNPDGSHARQVWPFAMECPHWSPDGTLLASCGTPTGDGSTILNVDTGQALFEPFLPGLFSPCFVWAPDAQRLACEASSDTDPAMNGIYTVRVSGWADVGRVTSNPGGDDTPGGYSPDGSQLVFLRSTGDGTPVGLFVVGVNGNGVHRITPAGSDVSSPGAWSPDGKWIAYSRHATPNSRQSLWLVHPDGTGLHEVQVGISPGCGGLISDPSSSGCSQPVWAPQGDRIAFSVNKSDRSHLYTADPSGQHPQHVADLTDGDFTPDWGVHPLAH